MDKIHEIMHLDIFRILIYSTCDVYVDNYPSVKKVGSCCKNASHINPEVVGRRNWCEVQQRSSSTIEQFHTQWPLKNWM